MRKATENHYISQGFMRIHTIKKSYKWRAMIACMPVSNETLHRRQELVKLRDVARQKIFHVNSDRVGRVLQDFVSGKEVAQ